MKLAEARPIKSKRLIKQLGSLWVRKKWYGTSELKLLVSTGLTLVIRYFSLHSEYQINIRLDNTGHTGRKLKGTGNLVIGEQTIESFRTETTVIKEQLWLISTNIINLVGTIRFDFSKNDRGGLVKVRYLWILLIWIIREPSDVDFFLFSVIASIGAFGSFVHSRRLILN